MKAYYRKEESKKLGKGYSWRVYHNAKSCASCLKALKKANIR